MRRITLALFSLSFALSAQTPAAKPPIKRPAAAAAKPQFAYDKAKLEAYLRHLYVYPDDIKMEVLDPKPSAVPGFMEIRVRATYNSAADERGFLVSKDGKQILDAKIYDVTQNPFQEDLDKLHTEGAPAMGTPGAPVVIVVFSDFQCPYCKGEEEMLRENLLKEYPKQVRLYFKDMPLQSIHPWARKGALAGRCAFAQSEEAFWKFHDWTYSKQEEITLETFDAKMDEFVKTGAVDKSKFDTCRAAPETAKALDAGIAEARALKINSTPTMFVNGRRIASTIRWENLTEVIDFEIGYQGREHNAGEACCTLAPPNPFAPK
jgi:protein-disulfide isomerase